jgi:predicted XRE-type DNA-binding protein
MGTNVFVDAGYAADDATVMAIRSDLAMRIAEFLERSRLNQVAAARQLGVPQPTISKIVNGRIENLSIELLIRMLVRASVPVVIQTGSTSEQAGAYVSVGESLAAVGIAAVTWTAQVFRPQDFLFVGSGAHGPATPPTPRWRLAGQSSGVAV